MASEHAQSSCRRDRIWTHQPEDFFLPWPAPNSLQLPRPHFETASLKFFESRVSQFLWSRGQEYEGNYVCCGRSHHSQAKLVILSIVAFLSLSPPFPLLCVCMCVCVRVVFISPCSHGAQPTKIKTELTGCCWSPSDWLQNITIQEALRQG